MTERICWLALEAVKGLNGYLTGAARIELMLKDPNWCFTSACLECHYPVCPQANTGTASAPEELFEEVAALIEEQGWTLGSKQT